MIWDEILNNKDYNIVVMVDKETIISSCSIIVIQNLTHQQRPYAVIENIVTDKLYQETRYATKCMEFAKEIAISNNCYNIMLLTGSKKKETLDFYRNRNYNSADRTGFIQWITP